LQKHAGAKILTALSANLPISYPQEDNNSFSLLLFLGTAGDSLPGERGYAFTTKDQDNDGSSANCALMYKGGLVKLSLSCIQSEWYLPHGSHLSNGNGVNWATRKGIHYSAKRAKMKITPVHI